MKKIRNKIRKREGQDFPEEKMHSKEGRTGI